MQSFCAEYSMYFAIIILIWFAGNSFVVGADIGEYISPTADYNSSNIKYIPVTQAPFEYKKFVPLCCPVGWSLVKISMGLFRDDKYDCLRATSSLTNKDTRLLESVEILGTTMGLFGYHVMPNNLTATSINMPRCSRQVLITISSLDDVELTPNSCLVNASNSLMAVSCPLLADVDSSNGYGMLELSFLHKCCPLTHHYEAQQRKCVLQTTPNFNIYGNIFGSSTNGGKGVTKVAIFNNEPVNCPREKVLMEYHLSMEKIRFEDGDLLLRTSSSKSFKYKDYCLEAVVGMVNNDSATEYLVRTCDDMDVCLSKTCIRRCCADGEMFTKGNATSYCKKDESDINFHSFESLEISGNFTKPPVFGILRSLDCLKFRLDPDSYADEAHTINQRDGSLYVMTTQKNYTNNQYCVEKIRNSTWPDQKLYTFLCFDTKVVGNDRIRFKMYPIGLLISCSFYAITLLVYLSISKLRNLPGKILICLVTSLFSAYLGIALGQLMPTPNDDVCFTFGFFVYFCLMAAFAWMNVMCFDIWQTFGSTKKKQGFKKNQTKRFLLYSLYGWGLPTVLTAVTVSLTKSNLLSDSIRPQFGHGRCWFTYDTLASANLLFFSGPVGILFLINFVLFSLTLRYCNRVKREIFRMQSSNTEKPVLRRRFFVDKARFAMNTKLFIVMGITWLLEILSILFYDHKKTFFWIVSDSFNVLLGVFVFFIFVFKKRVWHSILEKFGFRNKDNFANLPNATCATHSTYAHSSISMTRLNAIDGNTVLLTPNSAKVRRSPFV